MDGRLDFHGKMFILVAYIFAFEAGIGFESVNMYVQNVFRENGQRAGIHDKLSLESLEKSLQAGLTNVFIFTLF